MSFYNSSRTDATKPGRSPAATSFVGGGGHSEGFPTKFSDARSKLGYERPLFSDRFKNFSPSAKKSGEEILRDLKEQLRRDEDMFFNHSPPDWGFSPKSTLFSKAEDGEDFGRRSGMDEIRGRHPMFRMPAWMSEDEDMSDLAARMSHTPHFATMGRRGGPWRERRSSGGSAMSATSDDSCDAPSTDKSSQCSGGSNEVSSHEIPIRIEAPCPPSMAQQPQSQQQQHQQQQPQPESENEPISPLSSAFSHARKGAQCPVRTTSAGDATQPSNNVPRSTRCSSAPPEMADESLPQEAQKPAQQQRFVSKINITPQSPQSPLSSKSTAIPFSPLPAKFNTVPKPFVPANKQQSESQAAPYVFEQPSVPEPPQHQQDNQHQQSSLQHQAQQPQYQPQMPQYYQQQQQQQYQSQPHPQQYPSQQQQFHPQQQQHFQQQQHYQPQHQQQSQQSPRQGNQRPSIVRNIPIFVEGRDGPVTNEESSTPPKNTQQWGQPWQQQQQQPAPQQQQQPHQQHHHQPKQQYRQQNQPQQQAPQTQPIPTPMPAPPPPQQSTPQQPQQQPQQSEPQAKPQPQKDPRLTQIERVQASVDEYKAKVDAFTGTKKDREFLYLDEMLTRALLQLDNVDPDGRDDVRQARRAVIKSINAAISDLEARASDSKKNRKEKTPENAVVSMETETQEQSANAKDNQELSNKAKESSAEPAALPATDNTTAKAEEAKEECMETAEAKDSTSARNKEEAATTST